MAQGLGQPRSEGNAKEFVIPAWKVCSNFVNPSPDAAEGSITCCRLLWVQASDFLL